MYLKMLLKKNNSMGTLRISLLVVLILASILIFLGILAQIIIA
jgi:hypothetical protein